MIFRIIVALFIFNAIKIPSNVVPVIYYKNFPIDGFSSPFFIIIKYNDVTIIEHEKCHIEQMNKYGNIMFYVINAYYLYSYGYYENPFEIQAYDNCKGI